ncbi:hypothetical protein DAKH74_011790 [Maudiozyma humilis]|uniref:Uncharacterized protein n=1 Tax=Maudiozyma humilis TaxID=51915 RepID=A0AAV5RTL6_MAUHU|nr:hypothetical protein DAKH74_011790 [Kazachstania humilis]
MTRSINDIEFNNSGDSPSSDYTVAEYDSNEESPLVRRPKVNAIYKKRPTVRALYQKRPIVRAIYQKRPKVNAIYQKRPTIRALYQKRPTVKAFYQKRPIVRVTYGKRPVVRATYAKSQKSMSISHSTLPQTFPVEGSQPVSTPEPVETVESQVIQTFTTDNSVPQVTNSNVSYNTNPLLQRFRSTHLNPMEMQRNRLNEAVKEIIMKKRPKRGSLLNPDVVPLPEEYTSSSSVVRKANNLVERQLRKKKPSSNETPRMNKLFSLPCFKPHSGYLGTYVCLDEFMPAKFIFLENTVKRFLVSSYASPVIFMAQLSIHCSSVRETSNSVVKGCLIKRKHLDLLNQQNPTKKKGHEYVINHDEDKVNWSFFNCDILGLSASQGETRYSSDYEIGGKYLCMKWKEVQIIPTRNSQVFDPVRGNGVYYAVLDTTNQQLDVLYKSFDGSRANMMVLNFVR